MIYKSFDEAFEEVLVSYRNADPNCDTSTGSDLYVKGAGLASCVWGMQKLATRTVNQMFLSSADQETLLRAGIDLNVAKADGESWEAYLARLEDVVRHASGGGNRTDIERWAMEASYTSGGVTERPDSAQCFPAKFGPGTVVVVITKASGDPSESLLAAVRSYLMDRIAVVPAEVYVFKPTMRTFVLEITMAGGSRDKAAAGILSYIASLTSNMAFHPVVVEGICWQSGASAVTIDLPLAPIIPGPFERLVLSGAITWH